MVGEIRQVVLKYQSLTSRGPSHTYHSKKLLSRGINAPNTNIQHTNIYLCLDIERKYLSLLLYKKYTYSEDKKNKNNKKESGHR